jgi:hypothetical protein
MKSAIFSTCSKVPQSSMLPHTHYGNELAFQTRLELRNKPFTSDITATSLWCALKPAAWACTRDPTLLSHYTPRVAHMGRETGHVALTNGSPCLWRTSVLQRMRYKHITHTEHYANHCRRQIMCKIRREVSAASINPMISFVNARIFQCDWEQSTKYYRISKRRVEKIAQWGASWMYR